MRAEFGNTIYASLDCIQILCQWCIARLTIMQNVGLFVKCFKVKVAGRFKPPNNVDDSGIL